MYLAYNILVYFEASLSRDETISSYIDSPRMYAYAFNCFTSNKIRNDAEGWNYIISELAKILIIIN